MAGDLATAHPGEARLRAALAAAASGPVDPAWEDIRVRVLHDGRLTAGPGPDAAAPVRQGRRVALAAAAVLLVALAGLVVAGRPDGRSRFTAVGGGIDVETGWFLPRDLPLGWRVTSVVARRPVAQRCPGPGEEPARGIRWEGSDPSHPSGRFAVVITADPCPPSDSDLGPGGAPRDAGRPTTTPVALGPWSGTLATDAAGTFAIYTWVDDAGTTWTVDVAGGAADRAATLAEETAAAGSFETPALAALGPPADRWTEPPQPHAVVEVGVVTPEGHQLAYELVDTGAGYFRPLSEAVPDTAEGVAVRRLPTDGVDWLMAFGRVEPGTDITVWMNLGPDGILADEAAWRREAEVLVAALRPVTTEEWQATIGEVEHAPVLDRADRRADLADLDVPPRPDRPPAAGSTTTTAPR